MSVRIAEPEAVVKLEEPARLKAFHRFKEELLASLTVWSLDENIQRELPPVKCWLKKCVDELNDILSLKDIRMEGD